MFAENEKISGRQCARLLFFDFLGIGTLILPGGLARITGEDGIFSVAVGMAAALLYLQLLRRFVLDKARVRLEGDGGAAAKIADSLLRLLYGCYYLLLGGFALYLFGTVIQQTLLARESFWLITLLALLLAAYGMARGMESRARVYEVLFWLVVIPFLLMLALAVADVSPQQLLPVAVTAPTDLLSGSYLVFLIFSLCQMLVFSGNYIEPKKAAAAAGSAILSAGILFAALYEILLGVFGRATVAALDFPAVSLMSTVTIPGGFLHRQDALMVGVWFFTLFALICSSMYYGSQCAQQLAGIWKREIPGESEGTTPAAGKGALEKRVALVICGLLVYGISYACFVHPEVVYVLLEQFFWYLTPVYLLLPFLRACFAGRKRSRVLSVLLAFALLGGAALSLGGCSVIELENRSFPLLVAVGEQDGACRLIYKFQDLKEMSSKDSSASGGSEQEAVAGSFYEAMEVYEKENGRYMDLSHVKVFVLEEDFLENRELYEDFLVTLANLSQVSRNILVFVTEDVGDLTALAEEMDENMGTYLERMLQGNPNLDSRHQVTLGTILNDWQDQRRNLLVPCLSAAEKLPVVDGYYVIAAGMPAGKIDQETGELAGIFQKTTEKLEAHLSDRCHITVEDMRVTYTFTQSADQIRCGVFLTGKVEAEGSESASEEQIERFLEERLQEKIAGYRDETGTDLTNSFDMLSVSDRQIALDYAGRIDAYQERLELSFAVDLDLVE